MSRLKKSYIGQDLRRDARGGQRWEVRRRGNPIGRLCEIAPSTTGCGSAASPYATGYGYNVAGEVTGFKYGNGIYASLGFSPDRLQMTCLDYSTTNRSGNCAHDSTTKFGLNYSYGSAGSNNGQISSISDYVQAGRSITYTFDSLYRLTNAATSGSTAYPAWGLSESYDRYGNRLAQSISSGCVSPMTCPTNSVSVDVTKNQINTSGYGYDLSGNMSGDGTNTITYDGEGRTVTATNGGGSGTYTYDGNGLRAKKVAGGTPTVYIFSGPKVIAEYDNGAAPSSPSREYIYAGGTLLAKISSSGTFYYHQDHLSNRLITNSSGGVYSNLGHFPFGESWYASTYDKLNFTTYEYDSESGNHYAMARYHISRLGRLSSPDPIAGSTANPQSLNRYSYSINDPANVTDPSGASTGCNTAEAKPKDTSQQASGHGDGRSDTDNSDASEDAGNADANPPMQNGCVSRVNPFSSTGDAGLDWLDSFGGGLDGGFSGDDSGMVPGGGFQVGQGSGGMGGFASSTFWITLQFVRPWHEFDIIDVEVPVTLLYYFASGPPSSDGNGNGNNSLTPKQVKALFYKQFGKKLNDCIHSVFGADSGKVPQQTLGNAPVLNAMFTQQQLTNMAGQGAVGWNDPSLGPHGTVYEASDTIFHATGSNTMNSIFGTFAHELGNILDERMNPPGTTGGQPYGGTYGNPHEPGGDWDTGIQIEDCIFGGPQYPDQ